MNKELLLEDAINFTMDFYNKDRETVLSLYMDEVKAYMKMMRKCASDNPDTMCYGCDCWKKTREMCS